MDAVHLFVENEVLVRAYSGKSGWEEGSFGAGDAGVEDEEIDFIEVDKGVTVAFDDIKRANLHAQTKVGLGLLELGPKKWKSFLCPKRR